MRNLLLYSAVLAAIMLGGNTEAYAQPHNRGNNAWNHQQKKADKARAKYIKERNKQEKKYYKAVEKSRKAYSKVVRKHGRPAWAGPHKYEGKRHVYFQDYNTFYDPYRDGYVYLDRGRWTFSAKVPAFMINVNLGRANIRILQDIPINRHPEDFYNDYDRSYWTR